MTNGASLDLWVYSQEIFPVASSHADYCGRLGKLFLSAILLHEIEESNLFSPGDLYCSITCGWKSHGASSQSDEDMFMDNGGQVAVL